MVSQRDKSISHFHTDPKFVKQSNAATTLQVGQFVFLDTDGLYKLAISNHTEQSASVAGYVWSLVADGFYLKMGYGPMEIRFPDSYSVDIPGNLGDQVFLSASVSGGMQTLAPSSFPILVGYKTSFGLMYRACPVYCCTGTITAAPIPPTVFNEPNGLVSAYELYSYGYDCSAATWYIMSSNNSYIIGGVPSSLLNVGLSGNVSITGGSVQYIACISGTPMLSGSGELSIYEYSYQSDNSACMQTVIEPIITFGTLDELFECVDGSPQLICTLTSNIPSISLTGVGCCISGG